jgi:hypothetical protein
MTAVAGMPDRSGAGTPAESGTGRSGAGQPGSEIVIHKTQACYTYSRSVWQVHQEYNQLDPSRIGAASVGWKAAADQLQQLADELKAQIAAPLDAAWSSPQASGLAQARLQRAEATARALAGDCLQIAKATDLAATYAQMSKDTLPSYVDAVVTGTQGLVAGQGLTAGAKEAVQHMTALLDSYSSVLQMLPATVQSGVDPSREQTTTDGTEVGGGQGAGGVGSVGHPGGSSSGARAVSSSAAGAGPGHGTAGPVGAGPVGAAGSPTAWPSSADPYAAGSSLAGSGLGGDLVGFDPSVSGSLAGSATAAGGLGPAVGAAGMAGLGLGAGGLAAAGGGLGRAGLTGAGFGGAGTGLFSGPGVGGVSGPGSALPTGQAAASGAGRGAGMMPVSGAGTGEGEQERERSTWLEEDQDIWGIGGEDAPPPVIEE